MDSLKAIKSCINLVWAKQRKEMTMRSLGATISSTFTSISNSFRGLSRNVQFAIIIAVVMFTPVVSILFGIVFDILGFILGFVQWRIATLIILVFAGYKAYQFFQADLAEDMTDDTDPFV
jgi:hypothetical protein